MSILSKFAGTGVNIDNGGATAWSNPSNATGSNTSIYASAAQAKDSTSQALRLTNYGFNLTPAAIITNINAKIYKSSAGGSSDVTDRIINLTLNGSLIGNNTADTTTVWPIQSNAGFVNISGSQTFWGTSLDGADINSSTFGISISTSSSGSSIAAYRTARVYYVEMEITYLNPVIINVYDGTNWTPTVLRKYDGTAWQTVTVNKLKRWDGNNWVNT